MEIFQNLKNMGLSHKPSLDETTEDIFQSDLQPLLDNLGPRDLGIHLHSDHQPPVSLPDQNASDDQEPVPVYCKPSKVIAGSEAAEAVVAKFATDLAAHILEKEEVVAEAANDHRFIVSLVGHTVQQHEVPWDVDLMEEDKGIGLEGEMKHAEESEVKLSNVESEGELISKLY
jgi:ribonuclease BN (tRNA processing enzyme)